MVSRPHYWKRLKGQYESFEEWKNEHVTPEVELQLKKEKNFFPDQKQYAHYKAVLGNDAAPKGFQEFQKMKYEDPEIYSFVRLDYHRQRSLVNSPDSALPLLEKISLPDKKFTHYLFDKNHAEGWAKGRAFESRLGYNADNYKQLISAIKDNAGKYPVTIKAMDKYGQRYEQKMVLYGLNGKPANVIVGWINDGKEMRMTTAIIKEV